MIEASQSDMIRIEQMMTSDNTVIADNLTTVRQAIEAAALQSGRTSKEINLLAVSKTKSVAQIEWAIQAHQRHFGENYVQEGVEKIAYFDTTPYRNELIWHFIGPLQSNKSKYIATHFHWLHTLDSEKLAKRLSSQRPSHLPPLNVLIQVNISGEQSKSGVELPQVDQLVAAVRNAPNLCLRGLMAIPAPLGEHPSDMALQNHYECLKQLSDKLTLLQATYGQDARCQLDTLSMGMSDDLAVAIKAGSTMVRIGSAIFGARS